VRIKKRRTFPRVRLPPEAKGLSIVLGPFSRQANSAAPVAVNFTWVPLQRLSLS
jgi:hypothetical protein